MPTPTLDSIQPLVRDLAVRGRSVRLQFVCPQSGVAVSAAFTAPARTADAWSRASSTVSRSLMWSLRSTLSRTLRQTFGHGVAGRVAADLAHSAVSEASRQVSRPKTGLSPAEQDDAVLAAFASVQQHFVYDEAAGSWVHSSAAREALGAFDSQLAAHPVVHPYDRQVLGRMLTEVARADGTISHDEAGWLTEILADQGSIEDLLRRPPLTQAELAATSPGPTRRSAFLLAWALALVDESLAPGEHVVLAQIGAGLGLGARDQAEARTVASTWMIDQALERMRAWGGHDAHARSQLYALAQRLGLTQQQAEEAEARYLRRAAR